MAYRRSDEPCPRPSEDELTRAMVGIGMRFGAEPSVSPAIEDTLYWAGVLGTSGEYRVLDVLNTWLEVHSRWLNVSRLNRLLRSGTEPASKGFFAAFAQTQRDPRFRAIAELAPRRRLRLPGLSAPFQLNRRGEDETFASTCLVVHRGFFRRREEDVASPAELAKTHPQYRARIEQGPSFRADMWGLLESAPSVSAAQLARATKGSYATANAVLRDWRIRHP